MASGITLPSFGGGGAGFAEGGFVTSETHFFAGEHGPEVIIPLSSEKRSRALELFEQTAAILGGEAALPSNDYAADNIPVLSSGGCIPSIEPDIAVSPPKQQGSSSTSSNISLGGFNATFNVSGDNPREIVQTIKDNLSELAEHFMAEMSIKIGDCYENMALEG